MRKYITEATAKWEEFEKSDDKDIVNPFDFNTSDDAVEFEDVTSFFEKVRLFFKSPLETLILEPLIRINF